MEQNLAGLVENFDNVVIGIGNEWNWVSNGLSKDERYSKLLEYCKKEDNNWLLPIVEYEYAYYQTDTKIEKAYKALKNIIGDKKYFLVADIFLQDALMYGFDPQKSVYPCGTYMYLQTSDIDDPLLLSDKSPEFNEIVEKIHKIIIENDGDFDEGTNFVKPFADGKVLYLNQKRKEYRNIKYNESAYQERWADYMKFLTNTLNSKLLILELGVGLDYPTVIRWPFEKVAFINKQAHLIRVHEKLYQHTPEIQDKTESVQMNSVNYILQENNGR